MEGKEASQETLFKEAQNVRWGEIYACSSLRLNFIISDGETVTYVNCSCKLHFHFISKG